MYNIREWEKQANIVADVLSRAPDFDKTVRVEKAEFQARQRAVYEALRAAGFDAGIVYSDEHYHGDVPYLGIWAKPGAPYVCIEPWCGVNDDRRARADISEKDAIQRLPAGGVFDLAYTAEIL